MSVEAELKEILSDPYSDTIEDVVVAGGYLTPELLVIAYENGIFPWPHEGYPLLWFSPEQRGVIDFSDLHLPKSFSKWLRKNEERYLVKINHNFKEVIKNCRKQKRQGQKGSWINDEVEKNYNLMFLSGHAISVAVYRNQNLVGGIYGVQSKKYFSCESMFHLEDNVSKLAFIKLAEHLKTIGFLWMDLQMVTPVSEALGAKYIEKKEFLERIL